MLYTLHAHALQHAKVPVVRRVSSNGSVQHKNAQSVSVSVPGYGRRRKGSSAYYVYEVKVGVSHVGGWVTHVSMLCVCAHIAYVRTYMDCTVLYVGLLRSRLVGRSGQSTDATASSSLSTLISWSASKK